MEGENYVFLEVHYLYALIMPWSSGGFSAERVPIG